MNLTQRFMAQALLAAGLSQAGFIKAMKVVTMEDVPPQIAAERMKAAHGTPGERLFFGWAGETSRKPPAPVVIGKITTGDRAVKGNYYRIQAPGFLVEYDNTQNQSNHSHSVWRDFHGDFGLDVLAIEYRQEHAATVAGRLSFGSKQMGAD